MKVGWIGLGAMGGPMAACLADAGHAVRAFDIDPERAAGLADRGVDALLNHETSFFRDARSFGVLIGQGLGRLRAARAATRRRSLWSAGCSTTAGSSPPPASRC